MKEVTFEIYNEDKELFFNKHNSNYDSDYTCNTSPMTDDGVYIKTYCFTDGANWYERMSPAYETVTVKVHGVQFETQVKLQKIEYWSSEMGSRFYYEKW